MSFTQGLSGSLNVIGSITSGGSISAVGTSTVTVNSSDALLIEESGGTDVLRVDTVNNHIYINDTVTADSSAFPLTIAHNTGAAQIALEDSGGSADGKLGMDGTGNLLMSNSGPINISADAGSTSHLIIGSSTVDVGTLKLSSNLVDANVGILNLSAAGGTAVTIDSSAAITVSEILSSSGSNSNPSFTFSSDDTTGLYRSAAGSIGVTSAGTLKATFDSNGLTMNSSKIKGLADPTSSDEAVNKNYVDSFLFGLSPKESVRASTTSAGILSTDFEDGDTIDGVALSTNDRILIKDQTNPIENGIYIVQVSGPPVRADDLNGVNTIITTATPTGGNTVQIVTADINNLKVGDYIEISGNSGNINALQRVTVIVNGTTFDFENSVGAPSGVDNTGTVHLGAHAGGTHLIVQEGAINADIAYICSTNASSGDVVGRFGLTWVQFTTLGSLTGGDGVDVTASIVSIDEKSNGGLFIDSGQLAVDLGASSITGILSVSNGGTGRSTLSSNSLLTGNGTGGIVAETQLIFNSTTNTLTLDSVTGGSFIDLITDGSQDLRLAVGTLFGFITTTNNFQIHVDSPFSPLGGGVASFSNAGLHLVSPTTGSISDATDTLDVDGTANISGNVILGGNLSGNNSTLLNSIRYHWIHISTHTEIGSNSSWTNVGSPWDAKYDAIRIEFDQIRALPTGYLWYLQLGNNTIDTAFVYTYALNRAFHNLPGTFETGATGADRFQLSPAPVSSGDLGAGEIIFNNINPGFGNQIVGLINLTYKQDDNRYTIINGGLQYKNSSAPNVFKFFTDDTNDTVLGTVRVYGMIK